MTATETNPPDVRTAVVRWAVVGVLLALLLVAYDLGRTSTNPLNLVQPGEGGPSAEVFREDFPDEALLDSTGLDGQQFYAVARNPFDLDEAAEHLDRPRYRLQRPLLSWLGWVGHPSGGGTGLIWSLFAANAAGVAVLALATGALSVRFGGPAWAAALVGLYPGVWWSLRVTVADALATGLALAAVALVANGRTRAAVLAAVAAVLAKETALLLVVAWALAGRRDRPRWVPVVAAGLVGAAWAAYLRARIPGTETVGELVAPFVGLVDAVVDRWAQGDELWGLLGAATGFGAAAVALARRGLRHPLAPAILLQLAFLAFANGDVLGNDFGAGRATLPLLAVSLIAVLTPTPAPSSEPERARAVSAGG